MHSIGWWPTLLVLAIATFTDLRNRKIPNWLVVPFLLAGVVVSAWLNGWSGVRHSLGGFLLGAGLFGVLSALGGMGMGDVKLCAAIGVWIGAKQMLVALVLTAMAGGIMAIAWAVAGGFLLELLDGSGSLVTGLVKGDLRTSSRFKLSNPAARKMPYAPAIAVGTLLSFFSQ